MNRDVQNLYRDVTGPLTARGLTCTVEYGLSDWTVHAELPDGSYLFIAPPQEPPGDHPPGRPEAWLASWNRDDPPTHRLLYDSAPGGPDEAHRGHVPPLLRVLDTHLNRLGVPPRAPRISRTGHAPAPAPHRPSLSRPRR